MCTIRSGPRAATAATTSLPAPARGGSRTTTAGAGSASTLRSTRPGANRTCGRSSSACAPSVAARRENSTLTTRPVGPTPSARVAANTPTPPYRSQATSPSLASDHSATTSLYTCAAPRCACQNPVESSAHSRPETNSCARPLPITAFSALGCAEAARRADAPRRPGDRRPVRDNAAGAISTTCRSPAPSTVTVSSEPGRHCASPRPSYEPATAWGHANSGRIVELRYRWNPARPAPSTASRTLLRQPVPSAVSGSSSTLTSRSMPATLRSCSCTTADFIARPAARVVCE